jgi:hypothetical protein
MAISTNGTIITRLAGALYGEYMSNPSYVEVSTSAPATVASSWLSNDFTGKTDLQIATTVLKNLNLSSFAGVDAFVAGQLTAAGTTAAAKGARLVSMLNDFSQMTADPTFGAAANSFNVKTAAALSLSQTLNSKGGLFANADVVAITNDTFTLQAGTDALVGGKGNDTFAAPFVNSANTFTALDTVDGGDGTDTLNVSFNGAFTTPGGIKISNVENVNISASTNATLATTGNFSGMKNLVVTGVGAVTVSTAADVVANVTNSTPGGAATAFDGGSALTLSVTGSAAAGDSITVGAVTPVKGAVTIDLSSGTAAVVGSAPITSTGGSAVNVSSTMRNTTTAGTSTPGAIVINGTTDTTSIKVVQTPSVTVLATAAAIANVQDATSAVGGIGNSAITIADKNGTSGTIVNTLKSVELANYGNTTIATSALDTLTLSSTGKQAQQGTAIKGATLTVTDPAAVSYTKTLALNLAGGYVGVTTLPSYETINVNQTAATRVESIVDGNLKTLNVTGTGQFRLDAVPASLKTLDVTGAAGLRATISSTALTGFDGTKTTGANRITLNAAVQDYKGGTGADTVTITVSPTKVIDGGAGSDNLIFAGAGSLLSTLNGPNVQNFETLTTASASGIIDLANLTGSKFTSIVSSSVTTNSVEIDSVTPGTSLTISSNPSSANALTGTYTAGTTIYQTSNFTGAATAVTVTLAGGTPATNTSAGTIGFVTDGVNLRDATGSVGLGTVNIVSDASVGGGLHTITTLTNPNMSALNITGTGGLVITNLTDNAGSLDITDNHSGSGASKITSLVAPNIASLSYAGSAAYAIDGLTTNVVPTLTISNSNTSPTSGQLTIGALTNATATKVFLNGAVALTGTFANAALTKIVGGSNDSAVNITAAGAGGKTVTLGNGANTIVTGAGSDTITTGLGASKVTGAAGGDTITFGAGHTGVASVIYSATGETSTGAVTSGSTVVSAAAGYDIVSGLRAGDTIDLGALTGDAYTAGNVGTAIIAASTGSPAIVRGNWSPVTGYFATSATGTDSLVQWDSNGTAGAGNIESIILVGFVNTASQTTIDGVITLA